MGPSDAAEETLDFLNGFAQHCFAEEDIHPWVEDGVHRSDADGLQIGVLLNVLHQGWLVQLVHKHTHLERGGETSV